ncbi:hypothetical protein [Thermus phage P23-45]|uniref:Uncharacterized protein n=2 Tax=Oshimavirus TaxID=1623293 RepID=A7XXB5_BP234|nr:hypothetical protein P23p83 [Thermus phage P23-45]YP_001468052.1 hypothetical protein P74p82 [Thermus phage P74-26]API81886.1 hypothetical protein G20c_78 [Thermus phage G20c]ABU96916.1 hypothetical protein P23p83 [Thermus phage P23-45]ABU97032.1 hypothetical protein P74p82 [Thermus phage P74-26]UYB98508.1 hypothetical protein [Thermus phage P23-45]
MEYETLCDVCIRKYEGCYLYEFFIAPLSADGVRLEVKDCVQYLSEVESDEREF